MLVVVVLIDGFAAVPIRFDAPANIFSKISRAAGIGRANWRFVGNGVAKRKSVSLVKSIQILISELGPRP
jgi:hypothetical protein